MNIKEPQFRTITTPNEQELSHYRTLMEGHITEQHAGKEWAVVSIKDHAITLQELVRVRPAGMQYAVLQGRMPQDGSKPDTALILFPAWVSATLLCAGICGRVIELTDGSIIEGAVIPAEGTEQDLLDEIRSELGGAQQRVTDPAPARAEGMEPPLVQATCVHGEPGPCDICNTPKQRYAEGRELEQAYEEALSNIAELEANLDAWRTAANANTSLILNYGDTGIIKGIGINVESLASVQIRDQEIDKLRGLLKNIRRLSKQGKE